MSVADEPSAEVSVGGRPARAARALAGIERPVAVRAGVVAALFLFVLIGLPGLVSTFWLQIGTSVAIYSIVTLSLAVLVGRVGMVSLGQVALLAVGGWVALRLGFGTGLPFPLLLLPFLPTCLAVAAHCPLAAILEEAVLAVG